MSNHSAGTENFQVITKQIQQNMNPPQNATPFLNFILYILLWYTNTKLKNIPSITTQFFFFKYVHNIKQYISGFMAIIRYCKP